MENYAPAGPGVEMVHRYIEGGFHPVNIGDIYKDRYRVAKKLGFGSHSTVWLVEDLSLNRFASLKVLGANKAALSSEIFVSRYLQSAQERNVAHPGHKHVVEIFDTFIITGPNGTHHCIVTEILGISLASDVKRFYGRGDGFFRDLDLHPTMTRRPLDYDRLRRIRHFPEEVTRKVVSQVALAVDYLHKCGVIHGDLHLGNVLFYSSKLRNASLEEIERIYGAPAPIPIVYEDGTLAPPSPHLPQNLIVACEHLPLLELCLASVDDIHVKLCDFGEATVLNSNENSGKPFMARMPRVFAAPEIIFDDFSSATTSMDIWALGVLLFMIINEKRPPFCSEYEIDEEIIEEMVIFLGKLPEKWWVKWAERVKYFDDEGVHLDEELRGKSLRGIDRGRKFSDEERESFRHVLSRIFRYNPEDRIGTEEVVRLLPRGWVDPQALKELNCTTAAGDEIGRAVDTCMRLK